MRLNWTKMQYHMLFIPLSQCDKIKQELERMECMGVIVKVEEATQWCASMVAVPKKMDQFESV